MKAASRQYAIQRSIYCWLGSDIPRTPMTIPATAPPLSLFLGADPTVTAPPWRSSASRLEPGVSSDCVLPVTGTVGEGVFVADADVVRVCLAVPSSEVTRLSKLELLLLLDGRGAGTIVPPIDCDDVTLRVVTVGSGAGEWAIGVNVIIAAGGGRGAAVDVIVGGGTCAGGGVALAGGDVDSSAESSDSGPESTPSDSASSSASSRAVRRGTPRRTPLPIRTLAVADARGGRTVPILVDLAPEPSSDESMEVADSAPEVSLSSEESVGSA